MRCARRCMPTSACWTPLSLPTPTICLPVTWRSLALRHFKAGTFYIFRYLKKYTVFLDDSTPPKAYGVLGLRSDFDEILPMRPPIMVEAVLLPFGECIVFDGLLKPYNIYFGGNIRRRLDGYYRNAKEQLGIITSLLQQPEGDPATIRAGNKRVLKAFSQRLAGAGLRPQTIEKHITNVRRFGEASQPLHALHEATVADVRDYFSCPLPSNVEAKGSVTSLKKFFRFMIDSGRMLDAAYDILDDLKDHGDEYIAASRKSR